MEKFTYDGPVAEGDRLIQQRWQGETWANSPAKARVNLAYQFKKATKRPAMAKIKLPGEVVRAN